MQPNFGFIFRRRIQLNISILESLICTFLVSEIPFTSVLRRSNFRFFHPRFTELVQMNNFQTFISSFAEFISVIEFFQRQRYEIIYVASCIFIQKLFLLNSIQDVLRKIN